MRTSGLLTHFHIVCWGGAAYTTIPTGHSGIHHPAAALIKTTFAHMPLDSMRAFPCARRLATVCPLLTVRISHLHLHLHLLQASGIPANEHAILEMINLCDFNHDGE